MAYQKVDKLAVDDYILDLSDYMKKADVINMVAPVGHTMIRLDNTNPGSLPGYEGTTWQKISEGKVLIGANSTYPVGSTGGNATHSHTNPNTGGSSAANTGANNGSTGGSSASSTGSHTLTAAQSGVPAHIHYINTESGEPTPRKYVSMDGNTMRNDIVFAASSSGKWKCPAISATSPNSFQSNNATAQNSAANAASGHSHTMAHTHNLGNHSHTMAHTHAQGNTGSASSIPPYLAVNIWLRTA